MAQATLKERVERLERIVDEMQASARSEPGRDDWRASVGMFAGNAVAKKVIDAALRMREEERKQIRR